MAHMRVKLDIPLSIGEICNIISPFAHRNTVCGPDIKAICTDTRECKPGDLFIALKGEKDSGERYVRDAIDIGCFVISSSGAKGSVYVNDTVDALLKISKAYKKKVAPKYTVGITGSFGKSTTTAFLATVLRERYIVHSTLGNFNNHIGVPLTILSMPRSTEALVVEMGMNHKNEISVLSKCVEPELGIITAIGTSHIGNLGSREEIASAKLELFDGMELGKILMPYGEPLLEGINRALYVGRNTQHADFSLNDNLDGSYYFKAQQCKIDSIEFFYKRDHLLYDLALAISAAKILNLSNQEIIKGVAAITVSNIRQRFIVLNDFTIFDDSYNSSHESITADLKYIISLGRPTGAFLGDILELGKDAKNIHKEVGRTAARLKIDHLYLYGEHAENTALGAMEEGMDASHIYINPQVLCPEVSIAHIKENHHSGEVILFKGSHKLRLDKIADLMKSEERISNEH